MAKAEKKKLTKEERDLCRCETPVFRVSYPHIFKAQSPKETDKKKFSITMLIPKDADMTEIKEALRQAKVTQFGPDKAKWPKDLQGPVNDGDKEVDENGKIKEGYKNCWVIKATSNEDSKPVVVDIDGDDINTPSEVYPGCYARANLLANYWQYMGKQGIQFILNGVQKVKDGQPIGGGRPSKTDMFKNRIAADDSESSFEDEGEDANF